MTFIKQIEAIKQALVEVARVLAKPFESIWCSDKTTPVVSPITTTSQAGMTKHDAEWHRKTAEAAMIKTVEVDK